MNHIDALLALAPAGLTMYDTNVPETPLLPYLVLTAPAFREDAQTLSRESLDVDDHFTITAVGGDITQARWAQAKARLAFDRARPEVTGFDALVTLGPTSPFLVDRAVNLPGVGNPTFSVDRYRYRATPAPVPFED